jgi:hypothetical protein
MQTGSPPRSTTNSSCRYATRLIMSEKRLTASVAEISDFMILTLSYYLATVNISHLGMFRPRLERKEEFSPVRY